MAELKGLVERPDFIRRHRRCMMETGHWRGARYRPEQDKGGQTDVHQGELLVMPDRLQQEERHVMGRSEEEEG